MNKTKVYDVDLQIQPGSREVIAVISTDSVDREKEVVIPKGLVKKHFAGNPVVLFNHDMDGLPIGKVLWIKTVGNQVLAKYYVSDKTQFARDIFGLMQDGVLTAHSVQFLVQEQSPPTPKELKSNPQWEMDGCKNVVRKWDLLELSVCPIGCNQDALTLAVAKKLDPETIKFLGKDLEQAPEKDCWNWDNVSKKDLDKLVIEESPLDEKLKEFGIPVEKIKELTKPVEKVFNPTPKFCMSYTEIQKSLGKLLDSRMDEDELMARLKGKA